ncbi:MAG: hypothetical protein HC831_28900 [Chloroflexia bacterium]|nr:hypothetical protein [Chloroflexia bacterium]
MHTGKSYKFSEFVLWIRRNIYWLLVIGIIPVVIYQVFNLKWVAIPWTVVSLLGKVGESTENPFEGNSNDVPISQISRTIEIDMREMLSETSLPPALQPKNDIIL